MCSNIEFCREIVELLQKEFESSNRKMSASPFHSKLYGTGGAELLRAFEEQVLGQIVLDQAVKPEEAQKQLQQLIDWARKRGADVRFGSSGPGQFDHLVGEFFQRETGLRMTHVPYKGGGPALIDMISGDIQLMFATYVTAVPHVRGGRLRAIAVTTLKRNPGAPDVPTVAEALKMPDYEVDSWYALFAPARTSPEIVTKMQKAIVKTIQLPEVKQKLLEQGGDTVGSSPEYLGQVVKKELAKWPEIIKAAHIRVD